MPSSKSLVDYTDKEVKKRPSPELSERWWKAAWPGEGKPAADGKMVAAIKAYETAKGGKSINNLMNSLVSLKNASLSVETNAKKQLSDFPKRRDAILSDMKGFRLLANAELKKAKEFGKATRVVYSKDFAKALESKLSSMTSRKFNTSKIPVEPELLEAVIDELDASKVAGKLNTEYNKLFDAAVEQCAKDIVKLVEDRKRTRKTKKGTDKLFKEKVTEHLESLTDSMSQVPATVVKQIGLDSELEAIYQKSLTKSKWMIAKSFVFTGVSVGAIFLPGTQAFAIYGCVRNFAGLAQAVVELNLSIKNKMQVLNKQLTTLEATFKKSRAVSETGATTLNAILGVDIVPTLDKATSNLSDLQAHSGQVSVKSRKMIAEIEEMLDGVNEITSSVKKMKETAKKNGIEVDAKAMELLEKKKSKCESEFNKLLEKTHKLTKDLAKVTDKLPALEKMLKDLGKNSSLQIAANNAAKVIVNLTAIAGGGLVDATAATTAVDGLVKGADEITALTVASIGYADELIAETKDIIELTKT